MSPKLEREPVIRTESSLPYVAPFVVFFVFLAAAPYLTVLGKWEYPLRAIALIATLYFCSRHVIDFRTKAFVPSVLIGIAVFFLWIGPDLIFGEYRNHWLFQNAVFGEIKGTVQTELRSDPLVLITRAFRAIILVPIIEELFWRAWLMRWLITPSFWTIPLGAFSWSSMLITAVLFASEHGPYWDVGLATGLIYNWWMVRTRSLGDCIVMHAVTNACLSGYVLLYGKWEYWM